MGSDLFALFILLGIITAVIGGIAAICEAAWGRGVAVMGTLAVILGIVAVMMS